ncbi:MAG: gluconate 2-dehydrogenase subunit 3 family protein [Thaumarchaeota archaeon]|nr:gluconate 2-dehydrogenase subunit 3 family protein [Nitrososphaerota archaeon]
MADSSKKPAASDRRTFLKVGVGVVAGAAVASVVEIPYYNSIIGGNNNGSSTTVSSLQNQLNSTQSQLSDTQTSLSAAQSTITNLNGQLSGAQSSLTAAQSSLTSANSQNSALNTQLTSTQSSLTSATGQISSLQDAVTSANGQIASLQTAVTSANSAATSAQSQANNLQAALDSTTAFQTLGVNEAALVEAIAATFIPTDSNGPGATEAGVVYFIDAQLNGKYGASGHMYMQGPFIQHDLTTAVTPSETPRIFAAANGQTYTVGTNTTFSAGTMKTVPDNGMRYQYNFNLRYYWHLGLEAIETYANKTYGGNFETLSGANQIKCLQDLYNNVPTQAAFNDIVPSDFFYELFFMVYSGFTMDPMYGGNKGMVGWILTGNNGVNMGNFYGEGYTTKQIMVMSSPPTLKPASLGQYQKGSP